MKIGVLGTGVVGDAIATKIVNLGHHVMMGSRTATNEKAVAWAKRNGNNAQAGTFADAAKFGEILFNCTSGSAALDALKAAGTDNLGEKILIDLANPLDFSKGMPPSLFVCNTDSLAERIQRTFPKLKVVKSLNTVNYQIMVSPAVVPGNHLVFVCGNDAEARAEVTRILTEWFGWKSVTDLGDISNARALEMLLPLWVRLYAVLGTPKFNFAIVK